MQDVATQQSAAGASLQPSRFPSGFLWGVASAAHQVEGNNLNSDMWLVERAQPTIYREPSGDACNSFALWPTDMDLVKELGFNTYRFSLEWARIEPEAGDFSTAMLDHYRAMIEGCRDRDLVPIVTFSHFSMPRWFAARGGWINPEAPDLFARYCDRAARYLAAPIGYAVTLNEPNIINIVPRLLPPGAATLIASMNAAAGRACGSTNFKAAVLPEPADVEAMEVNQLAAHKAGRAALKAVRSDLPVGASLSMSDDQAAGPGSIRDSMRKKFYGPWVECAKTDDFIGVQNYTRLIWGSEEKIAPPEGAQFSQLGTEIYAQSLAGAVRYAYEATGVPVLVTEHGLSIDDDVVRVQFIRDSLAGLQKVIAEGVPVSGYIHWSLLESYEWLFGYAHRYGLCTVDRTNFKRTPKPSAYALGQIARRNSI
jgi:beta-glucosidase